MNTNTIPSVLPGHEKVLSVRQSFDEKLAGDYQDLGSVGIVDGSLKHPGRILYEIIDGSRLRITLLLLGLLIVCMAAYGFVMGTFSGAQQLWVVPLKVVAGTIFSLLICLPSLYIFSGLSGSVQTFTQSTGIFIQSLALSGLLLVGFAPVAWIFGQSTNAVVFMGILHLVFWGIGAWIGMELLASAHSFVNKRQMVFLKIWVVVFVTVVFQMTTTLRPLVGKFNGYSLEGKKFFVTHWIDSMEGQQGPGGNTVKQPEGRSRR